MTPRGCILIALIGIAAPVCVLATSADQAGPPAKPSDPIAAILEAFRTHTLVTLGHPHGIEEKAAFELKLVRDPRFAGLVNDIVDECGNSRHQDVMDQYVRGEDVPYATLRRTWEDALPAGTNCDLPMYEELFRTVREVNRSLPADRRLRVLLGEGPIDWDNLKSYSDLAQDQDQREEHLAGIIRREVLSKGRKALLVFGEAHLQRKTERLNYEVSDRLVGILERQPGVRVFNIWPHLGTGKPDLPTLQADAATWPVPSLALLRDTSLGALDFTRFFTSDGRLAIKPEGPAPVPREAWKPMHMEEQFDALLYLGPTMTVQRLALTRCAEPGYLDMRLRRLAIVPSGQAQIDRLKRYCGKEINSE